MSKYTELDRLAARHGFILVYPAARRGMWATVNIDASELDDNPDLLFIGQLIDEVGTRLNVDSNRVYLVGMSNGASFAQLVAFARPDVAAVVAHSGPKPHGLNEAVEPFPIMLVAGANDLAAEAMRSDAIEYRKDKHPVDLIVVPGLGHEWSTKHNAVMWSFLSRHQRRN
jgi:poly(3-hydroxybutyrate) depolymerase